MFYFIDSTYAQKKVKGNTSENQNLFGSKKKERRNQSNVLSKRGSVFKRKFSAGNADAFASHKIRGKRGLLAKLFHSNSQVSRNASLRKTKPGRIQDREQLKLFGRYQSVNKRKSSAFLNRQNKKRKMSRRTGNSSFMKRKR